MTVSQQLLDLWLDSKELIHRGYNVLDKEVSMGMPAVSFPASTAEKDSGIGSPYGEGAAEFNKFFSVCVDKVLLTPTGETFPPTFSPYTSTLGYNPLLIPLERTPFLTEDDLSEVYSKAEKGERINYTKVSTCYDKALKKMYKNYLIALENQDGQALLLSKSFEVFKKREKYIKIDADFYHKQDKEYYLFIEFIADTLSISIANMPYIDDVEVKIPDSYVDKYKGLFLSSYSLGTPPDALSDKPRNWGFAVLNPEEMFTAKGALGKAGKLLYDIFESVFRRNNGGGVRIDHFIGLVNPFVIPDSLSKSAGRLYSSPDNPELAKYCKHGVQEFANIARDIVLKAAKENGFANEQIYPEDIGNRPLQLDEVLNELGLGRMLISMFVEPENNEHMYRLKNASPKDIAVINTHDMPSLHEFYREMSEDLRYRHARQLAEDLRFSWAADLPNPENLIRMKWAELMASPAKRVQGFFTGFTGQKGRFNQPSCSEKWLLRCNNDYKSLYFSSLKQGIAYNPFDAICIGIWAKGNDFFQQNEKLIKELRAREEALLNLIEE